MTGTADLEFRFDHDEGGDRLLLGVESDAIKLAVVVPDDVPRAELESATAVCVRELRRYTGTADGQERPSSGPEQVSPGYEEPPTSHERADDER